MGGAPVPHRHLARSAGHRGGGAPAGRGGGGGGGRGGSGLETLQAIRDGALPPAPIGMLMQFDIRALEEGRVEFGCTLDEWVYTPIGVVHGGLVCTLLDTVAGCAVHTTLPAGVGYTSIEIKVNYLR